MKIVFLDEKTVQYENELNYEGFRKLGEFITYPFTKPEEALERIGDADVLLLNKSPIKREIIEKLPNVKLITLTATGYDNVDIKVAREKNIAVANVPAYSTHAVAQLTMSFILVLATQLDKHLQDIRGEMKWNSSARLRHNMMELNGKTLGIIGLGNIGQQVSKLAQAFGMKILAYTPHPKQITDIEYVELEKLASESDFITIHCSLNERTYHLVDKNFIGKMKKTAYLINTSRGAITNENDLAEALKNKQVAGLAVDATEKEPPATDHPFYSLDNVLLTPHVAWSPIETRQRLLDEIVENIRSFFAGIPRNIVN